MKYQSHGMRHSPEYNAWRHMKDRCFNSNNPRFKDWGGRGITVFEPWINNFIAFYEHVGPRPNSVRHSLERIDNNGNYEPGNVKWATYKEQANNQNPRPNRTGYTGVCAKKNRFVAQINLNGSIKNLGSFKTPEEAHQTFLIAKKIKEIISA